MFKNAKRSKNFKGVSKFGRDKLVRKGTVSKDKKPVEKPVGENKRPIKTRLNTKVRLNGNRLHRRADKSSEKGRSKEINKKVLNFKEKLEKKPYAVGMPKVLILGEKNVGKSSLFNKITGVRTSIVADVEGLTRDVIINKSHNYDYGFIDSPGTDCMDEVKRIIEKTNGVDGFCLVIKEFNKVAKDFLKFMKQTNLPYVLVVNYFEDSPKLKITKDESFFEISVRKNKTDKLERLIKNWFNAEIYKKALGVESEKEKRVDFINDQKWAFVGRSNVGKSTILNKIIGKDRFVVEDEIGTTQEVHGSNLEIKDKNVLLVDTPGYRKNNKLSELDRASQYRLENIMGENISVFVVLMDIREGIKRSDLVLIERFWSKMKPVVVAIGMEDLIKDKSIISKAKEIIRKRFNSIPCVAVSGQTGFGLGNLKQEISEAHRMYGLKFPTNKLNKWMEEMKKYDIFNLAGIKYVTQFSDLNLAFAFFTNKRIKHEELKFLKKKLAKHLKIEGFPIKLIVKHKQDSVRNSIRK
ncbi:GTPase [Candidatus Nesciobacter abundans]|uniref:GTP-binding protein n=1 Tax=Candidatus Nesciobacter abundans TaxID=2601668 RepID=A0A5C0UHT4_9PROT|nr:GTPase [Candidatus Nesciobacter abundans]QEK39317.1 GTP-binding protein [Candidatus Nesciobacter abundans]